MGDGGFFVDAVTEIEDVGSIVQVFKDIVNGLDHDIAASEEFDGVEIALDRDKGLEDITGVRGGDERIDLDGVGFGLLNEGFIERSGAFGKADNGGVGMGRFNGFYNFCDGVDAPALEAKLVEGAGPGIEYLERFGARIDLFDEVMGGGIGDNVD